MSCGNRFQCGLTKSTRRTFQPDKPSNPELHSENQQRLNALINSRAEFDKQYMNPTTIRTVNNTHIRDTTITDTNIPDTISICNTHIFDNSLVSSYTPWTIPSTADYKINSK